MLANIQDYESARSYLGNKKSRPCGNNTRIEMDSLNLGHAVISITYHDNVIVNYYPDRITLHNQGWYTSTTKERLNHFIPDHYYISQKRGVWYLHDREHQARYVWADGITLYQDGVQNAGDNSDEDNKKQLTKQIHTYVKGFVTALLNGEIEKPSGGDCWYCHMVTDDGQSLGDVTGNCDHILNHMEESYYVPSLLINAIKAYPVGMLINSTIGQLLGILDGEVYRFQKEVTERQVTSSLRRYLKHQVGLAS